MNRMAKIIADCERHLQQLRAMPASPCIVHANRPGVVRVFGAMSVRVCDPCAMRLELMACVPGEIEAETSRLVTAIQVRL